MLYFLMISVFNITVHGISHGHNLEFFQQSSSIIMFPFGICWDLSSMGYSKKYWNMHICEPYVTLKYVLEQSYICLQRKLVTRDHKLVYWFGGAIASLSILLERKTQRAELALYVLSNAANSLWYILVKRHLIPEIPYAEV